MSIACDPNYKRKEYLLKITRLQHKIDMARILDSITRSTKRIEYLEFNIDPKDQKEIDILRKEVKKLESKLNILKSRVKFNVGELDNIKNSMTGEE